MEKEEDAKEKEKKEKKELKKKGFDVDVIMIMPTKSLGKKLKKMAEDQGKREVADVAEKILEDWFVCKRKEMIRDKKDFELKEKRKAIVDDIVKNIRLLK